MNLSKAQLDTINQYLIRSKVKYWDIRMELLDHIARAVEDKMEQGSTFEHALFQVHKEFGNRSGSIDPEQMTGKTLDELEYIFKDHSAYKRIVRKRGFHYHWQYQRTTLIIFWKIIRFPGFLLSTVLLFGFFNYLETSEFQELFKNGLHISIVGFLLGQVIYMFIRNLNVSKEKDLLSARYLFNIFSLAQILNYLFISFAENMMQVSSYLFLLTGFILIGLNIACFLSLEKNRQRIIDQYPYLKSD